ncbi:hypothetical protein [Streptacidiphilus sp. MAP5-52]|uniref:hypothetical protein n=1 Tax=Streptacidiphilus sp. MAP5-52 TaxID=3156267 RepID=UPI0035173216
MTSSRTRPRFLRSGHWLVVGGHRVFLEPSPFTDALVAQAKAQQLASVAQLLRALPRPWL